MLGMATSAGFPEQAASVWSAISGEIADLLDNVQWESAWPVVVIVALLFFAIFSVALSTANGDEEEAEYWRRLALAGRGMFSVVAVMAAVGWMGGHMTGLV
jgi:hypothetical protein